MTQILLAILDRAETADLVLDAAAEAAARLDGGAITGLVIRHPAMEGILPTEEVAGPAMLAERQAAEEARIAGIRAHFDAWAARGHAGRLQEETGETEPVVTRAAQQSDVLVVGHAPGAERDAGQAMDVALFAAHVPSLFVPAGAPGPFGRHIAIAWKPSAAAERAVASALPLLLKAERVTVLTAAEGRPAEGRPTGTQAADTTLAEALQPVKTAGIAIDHVDVAPADRTTGQALLQAAHAAGADLLVMGAFTRARWSEFLLGGVTRDILQTADLPVLMQH